MKNFILFGFVFLFTACSSTEPAVFDSDGEFFDLGKSDTSRKRDTGVNDVHRDVSMQDMLTSDVSMGTDLSVDIGPDPKPAFDINISPSCDEAHAEILRYYQTFFGRFPDIAGANHWMTVYNAGTSLDVIATSFAESAEYLALYNGLSDEDFVATAYRNSFNRMPDDAGAEYFLDLLQTGTTRIALIRVFATSDEMKTKLPYAKRAFCTFVESRTANYTLTQLAPKVLYARSGDGNINAVFIEQSEAGTLRVPAPEPIASACANRSIPNYRRRAPGYFGGTVAINGNWFGCYLPKYFAGYSVSEGVVLSETVDGREGFLGQNAQGKFVVGYYPDTAGAVPAGLHHAISGKRIVGAGVLWPPVTTASGDPTFTNRNPRTGGGLSPEGYLILAVVDGRTKGPGMTGTELGNLFISFGAKQALAFDGGGSSALFLGGRGIVSEPSDGSARLVANQLVFDASTDWIE